MLLYNYGKMPAISIDVDETKLSSLGQDVLSAFESTKAMTPWFDRMDTDLGNEFNNKGVAIANGDDVETTFNDLQSYAESR